MNEAAKGFRYLLQKRRNAIALSLAAVTVAFLLFYMNWSSLGYAFMVRDGMQEQPLTIADAQNAGLFICRYDLTYKGENEHDSTVLYLGEAWVQCTGTYRGSLLTGDIVRTSDYTLCVRYSDELPSYKIVNLQDGRRVHIDRACRIMNLDIKTIDEKYDLVVQEWGGHSSGRPTTQLGVIILRLDRQYEY